MHIWPENPKNNLMLKYIPNYGILPNFITGHDNQLTSNSTIRLLARSDLLPARAMTMLGLACLCNSFTQVFALPNVSCKKQRI